jgi:hypothetical protein
MANAISKSLVDAAAHLEATARSWFTALFVLHLVANAYHAWSHMETGVATTPAQSAFIVIVVFLCPALALALVYSGRARAGCALFAASMLASLVFSVSFHYLIVTPDLCSNGRGVGAAQLRFSAATVALVQAAGFLWAVLALFASRRHQSRFVKRTR